MATEMVRHNLAHQVLRDDAPLFYGDHESDECGVDAGPTYLRLVQPAKVDAASGRLRRAWARIVDYFQQIANGL